MHTGTEDQSVFNDHYEVAIVINRPVVQVWKKFLNIPSWVTSHEYSLVSGEQDQVGAITRLSFKRAEEFGMPGAHHHYCKIIKIVPKKQYVLKTFTEEGGSYGWNGIAFDDTRFVELDGLTLVTFNMYAEIRSQAYADDPSSLSLSASREGMLENLRNLKTLVER